MQDAQSNVATPDSVGTMMTDYGCEDEKSSAFESGENIFEVEKNIFEVEKNIFERV